MSLILKDLAISSFVILPCIYIIIIIIIIIIYSLVSELRAPIDSRYALQAPWTDYPR